MREEKKDAWEKKEVMEKNDAEKKKDAIEKKVKEEKASSNDKKAQDKDKAVKEGSRIKVEYTGTFDDGKVFDKSEGRGPLEYTVGAKQVIPGFENNIKGMKVGEEKKFKVEFKDAYGLHRPDLVQKIPKSKLPEGLEVKEGMLLVLKGENGINYGARVIEVLEDGVKVDLNHPLAGKNLNFNVKVVEIS